MFTTLVLRSQAARSSLLAPRLTCSMATSVVSRTMFSRGRRSGLLLLPSSLSPPLSLLGNPRSFSRSAVTQLGHSVQSNPPNNSLFVGNLPWSVTMEELQELFGEFGEVESVRIHTHADGRPRGFGHVEFASKENAIACFTSAMEEPIFFAGRDLVIDYAKGANQKGGGADAEPNNRLYFTGCKEGEVALKDVFAGHAQNIISIYFLKDGNTGDRLPRGFVEFKNISEATEALNELNGVELSGGDSLGLSYARPPRKREFNNNKPFNPRLANSRREKYTARSWNSPRGDAERYE